MKHLDLFSGIGGFALAARWAEIETIQFVEKDVFCKKVLKKNFPNVPVHDDIKDFDFNEPVDILTGGFPCQPFSVAGKRKGFSDDRYLWPEMFRIIKQCRPRFIIAENVPGIVPMLDPILEDLERENYSWQAYLIPASLIGAPHKRERLWIIAHLNSIGSDYRFYHWKKGYLQENHQWNLEEIQQKWQQLQPDSWSVMSPRDWLQYNRKSSGRDDGLSNRMDRIKSLGNAIVPQIAYLFFKVFVCSLSNKP